MDEYQCFHFWENKKVIMKREFILLSSKGLLTYGLKTGEPIALYIIPSGFIGKYNVIIEDGEMESVDLFPLLSKEQLLEEFGIDIDITKGNIYDHSEMD